MIVSVRSLDKGVVFEGEVQSLNLKTTSGDITVLDRHRPLMTELVPCTATVTKADGTTESIVMKGGFLEVNRSNQVLVMVD